MLEIGFFRDCSKPTMTIEHEGPQAIHSAEVDDENVNLVINAAENEIETVEQPDTKYFPAVAVIS